MKLEVQESASISRPVDQVQPIRRRAGRQELEGWRRELDKFYEIMSEFAQNEETIFQDLSAMSARASEIRTNVVRAENKALQVFRTQEIDPFLKECDRQFKLWSRVLSYSQYELELTR